MKILLIKLKHIGDSLLLTASTRAIRQQYPNAEISVLVRKGCEGILVGAESIDHVYTSVAPESENRHLGSHFSEFKWILQLRRQRFDVILELTRGDRGRWWTLALSGKCKATYQMKSGQAFWNKVFDQIVSVPEPTMHAVLQDYHLVKAILGLKAKTPAALEFSRARADPSYESPQGAIVIHPATRWKRKQWPETAWGELIRSLVSEGERVVLSSGPDVAEMELCQRLARDFDIEQVQFTGGGLSWAQLAGVLYRSKAFIGVDTAAMHLASACGTPTVGLFLPWIAPMWHPWQVVHQAVAAAGFPTVATPELNDLTLAVTSMEAISPAQVQVALRQVTGPQ